MATDRLTDFDGTWFRGSKSDCDPGQVPLGYNWMTVNMINQGGLLSCRPGHRCIVKLPQGNLQGAAYYQPKIGLEQFVVVVDGIVYVSTYPFDSWRMLAGVVLSPTAAQVFFCMAEQSARRLDDTLTSAIEIINPKNILIIQDGGYSPAIVYDGSTGTQERGKAYGIPSGASMQWVGDRLWVAKGSFVYASDIANPLSFRELIYLGGVSAFVFPSEVTAMAVTPSLEFPQLLVFTSQTTHIVKASVRERDTWESTQDMQREILPIGCSSARSVVSHFGQLQWFTAGGIVIFDAAMLSKQTGRFPLRDLEMLYSKRRLGEDLSRVAGGAYGQYVLMSVPAEDNYNRHTWVLNNASMETISDASGPSWCGYWTGTRPVQWVYGYIAGRDRIYHVSADEDGENRLWESFTTDRLDNGCPIQWAFLSRGYFGMTCSPAQKLPGLECKLAYADVSLIGIEEDINLAVFYAGGLRGAFKQIYNKLLKVEKGSLQTGQTVTATSQLFAFKAQTRKERTEDVRNNTDSEETGSCSVDLDKEEGIDENFQLLVVGLGPATMRYVRVFGVPEPEELSGSPEACVDETGANAVRFDGFTTHEDTVAEADSALAAIPLQKYESSQTATVTYKEFTEIGVGHAHSIISQEAADRLAYRIAVRAAEVELSHAVPKVYSASEGF